MKVIVSNSNDPYYNLSLEETLLKDPEMQDDILLLYINKNTIVFGRNQNVHEEINSSYVKENNIKLVRRVSGGGAVYHDEGNLNFSFITNKEKNSYTKFLTPIIKFLNSLNLDAQFKGRNDVQVNGFKVSGNAQFIYKERMFHHGTLLFDANLSVLASALKVNKLKLESKSIKSARQRVSNILDLLETKITIEEFREKLINSFEDVEHFDPRSYKTDEIKALMNVRKSDDWIYGKSPKFNVKNEKRFDGGTISVLLEVEKNIIKDIKIFGDFLSVTDPKNLNDIFVGNEFKDEIIKNKINEIEDFKNQFGTITKEELSQLILGE